jgi:hypothetical protein
MGKRSGPTGNGDANKLSAEDRPVHDWYRFVLSFPPHLVRNYLDGFGSRRGHRVLDPFCGTGTTLVECKKLSIGSVGVEGNPMAHFASRVKVDWTPDPDGFVRHAAAVAQAAETKLEQEGLADELRTLAPDKQKLLLAGSISPLPLHRTLVLLDRLNEATSEPYGRHERLALAKALVGPISNLHFGPEVGVAAPKADAPAVDAWRREVGRMADDLQALQLLRDTPAVVHQGDSRHLAQVIEPCSVDAVITSPPYPNEKDYTRTTRLESVLLGFIHSRADLQALKKGLVRSNTRGVYRGDDDDRLVAANPKIQAIAAAIEARRLELGKTSGFERLYARVTKLYFGGMTRHLAELRAVLRPGAQLAYVVGDQASYLRVMIRTGQLLGEIAESLGYELRRIDLFRTRLATATGEQLREEVVVLRWPG